MTIGATLGQAVTSGRIEEILKDTSTAEERKQKALEWAKSFLAKMENE